MTTLQQPVIRGARFFLVHTPGLVRYGSRPSRDIARDASLEGRIGGQLRAFAEAAAYPPNQTLLGRLSPDELAQMPRPWFEHRANVERRGPHGEIMPEEEFFALLAMFDSAGLVSLSEDFVATIRSALQAHPLLTAADIARLKGTTDARIDETLRGATPALPLKGREGRRIGCIRGDHAEDNTLFPDVLLENLTCKATAIMALRALLDQEKTDPRNVGYVINSGEEAVGDRYQRGGGNLAKAIAEMCGCAAATGVDAVAQI